MQNPSHHCPLICSRGTLASAAAWTLLALGGCLRFAHLQRSHSLSIQGDLLCGVCAKGKHRVGRVRPPFPLSAPARIGAFDLGDRILTDWREMQERQPQSPFVVPDLVFGKTDPLSVATPRVSKPMSIRKFAAMLQALFLAVKPSGSLESRHIRFAGSYLQLRMLCWYRAI